MKEHEIRELVQKGHILCKVIFEMAGSPQEHVEKTLKQYIAAIKEDPTYIFMNEYMAPTEEQNGVWSTFFEAEVLVANLERLNILCFNLGPASIEILEPKEFLLTQKNMMDWYNDLLSRIHEISAVTKNLQAENDLLKVNLNRAIRNLVTLALAEPKTADEVSTKIGIGKEHIQPFLDALIKERSVILDGETYRLNK